MAQDFVSAIPDGSTNIFAEAVKNASNMNTLLSNFSGSVFPSTPVAGQLCYRTDEKKEYIYNGTAWVEVGSNGTLGKDVSRSKGQLASLTDRLSVSMNLDGTLKSSITANVDEFKISNVTPTYVDSLKFSVVGDLTGIFTVGRMLRIVDNIGILYCLVSTSVFDAGENKTYVSIDKEMDTEIIKVDYSIIQFALNEVPTQAKGNISKKIANTEFVAINGVPVGAIVMWAGTLATIPTGWGLCDGTDGKPNLLGRFVKGVASSGVNPSGTGGASTVTLDTANLPSHAHTQQGSFSLASGYADSAGAHTHTYNAPLSPYLMSLNDIAGYAGRSTGTTGSAGSHTHSVSGTITISGETGGVGSGSAFSIEPPYFEIAYIIKL